MGDEIYRSDGPTVVKVKEKMRTMREGWTEAKSLALTLAREIDLLRDELAQHADQGSGE